MPRLSDSMEEGTILSWLKQHGETVEPGEDLVEIETDKATVTCQAEASGVLSIVAAEGTTLPVGATIGWLGPWETQADPAKVEAAPSVAPSEAAPPASSRSNPQIPAARPMGNGDHTSGTVKATPLARRIAGIHDVLLEDVEGSGPLGRITRDDVLRKLGLAGAPSPIPPPAKATAERAPDTPAVGEPPAGAGAKGDVEVAEPTRLQAIIARRMAEAKATIPHFQVQTEVTMDAAIALRTQLKHTGQGIIPSFNDLVVKAAALALRAHPIANGSYRDGRFEQYARINVGIAVAADGALVVPTIFDADVKSLGAIASEARRLADRVRDGSITPAELGEATFTISNLGMYGMTAITPVINVPQAAILGVGALRDGLARIDGAIVDRHLMTMTLSCDHRILYGAQAAEFLSTIRGLLEEPLRLAL